MRPSPAYPHHRTGCLSSGKLPFVPSIPLVSPATFPEIKPLAPEPGHEFLGILFQREALNEKRLVIVKKGMAAYAPRKALAEFVLDCAVLACTKSAVQHNLKWPTAINTCRSQFPLTSAHRFVSCLFLIGFAT